MPLSNVPRLIVSCSAYRTAVLDRRRGLPQRGRDSSSLGGWEVAMLVIRACDIGLEKRGLDCPYMREIDQISIQYCAVRTINVRYEGWHTFVGSSE
jgi:hypothetical protein